MTTRNKLAYLQESIPRFCREIRAPDEELLVVDGASSDGSQEFLRALARKGSISWLISEPDYCEAHALNKALLAARGDYITILTDDDVFDFDVLRQLHDHLDRNPDLSVAYPSGADTRWNEEPFVVTSQEIDVLAMRDRITDRARPFPFSGLGLTFRRSALPEIGLFDLNLKRVDLAMSWRLTASPVRIVGCTAFGYVRILNEQSLTVTMQERNFEEKQRIFSFYGYGQTPSSPSSSSLLRRAGRVVVRLCRMMWHRLSPPPPPQPGSSSEIAMAAEATTSAGERMRLAEEWLKGANAARQTEFVTRR